MTRIWDNWPTNWQVIVDGEYYAHMLRLETEHLYNEVERLTAQLEKFNRQDKEV